MGKRGPKPRDPEDVKSAVFSIAMEPKYKEIVDLADLSPDFWRSTIFSIAAWQYAKKIGAEDEFKAANEDMRRKIARHTES